jgi:predicted Zn-dependent protease with MMP-like domain
MIVSMTLGLEWGPDKMMALVELSVHDFDMSEEILKDIDFEHEELLLGLWVGSASRRN